MKKSPELGALDLFRRYGEFEDPKKRRRGIWDEFWAWIWSWRQTHEGRFEKWWRGYWVDRDLKENWLERVNSIPGLEVWTICAGHVGEDWNRPTICFTPRFDPRISYDANHEDREAMEEEGRIAFRDIGKLGWMGSSREDRVITACLTAHKTRAEMSDAEFDDWWETVITRLEQIASN